MTDSQPVAPFVIVPTELLTMFSDGKLTPNGFILYQHLLARVNRRRGDAKVWPSRRTLARQMRFGETRTVDRYITELETAGLLRRERRREGQKNDTNVYTLLLTRSGGGVDANTTAGANTRGGARASTRGGVRRNTRVVFPPTPELDEVELDELQPEESLSPREPDPAPVGADLQDRERDRRPKRSTPTTKAEALAQFGVIGPDEAAKLIPIIDRDNDVRNLGFYIHAAGNGTLADCIRDARAKLHSTSRLKAGPGGWPVDSPVNAHGSWCGQCDGEDRMVDAGTLTHPAVKACPNCHRDNTSGRRAEGRAPSNKLRGQTSRPADGTSKYDEPGAMDFR